MKVLHYVDTSAPGGIETHLAALLPALRAAGVDAGLLFHADHGPHPLRDALSADGVPHATLAGGLLAHVRAARPDLVHTHGYKAGILARKARLCGGPPVVSTMHSGAFGTGRAGLYNRLDALTAPLSHRIVVSPALLGRHRRATLIPNGIALPPKPAAIGQRIGFVGRFSEEKAPLDFVELARRLPGQRFVAFGDGPQLSEARSRAPANLDLRGSLPSMNAHWPEIGLLVMPSRFEGLPMAALEAMARGIPVAAYAVGGLPALLDGDCGFPVEPGQLVSLAGAVEAWHALDATARDSLAERVRSRVGAAYSIEACARATLSVYRRILTAPPVSAPA